MIDNQQRLTRTGQLIGTPEFMSPEQARGDLAKTGPHSDVFSLGVILYRLLAGQVPFEETDSESSSSPVRAIFGSTPARSRISAPTSGGGGIP